MGDYLRNTWVRVGLALVVFGWGPLLAVIFLDAVGLWPDPNPNPIGPGLLFFFTAWPALITLGVGFFQVWRARAAGDTLHATGVSDLMRRPLSRLVSALAGVGLLAYGFKHLLDGAGGMGPAAALVLGVVALHWAIQGRLPGWFRHRS